MGVAPGSKAAGLGGAGFGTAGSGAAGSEGAEGMEHQPTPKGQGVCSGLAPKAPVDARRGGLAGPLPDARGGLPWHKGAAQVARNPLGGEGD